jgi:signal transduction histidine kinase
MKELSDGTYGVTSGLGRTTWRNPSFGVRLAAFALAVAGGAFLIGGIDSSIWREQGRLEEGFATIKAEKFYFGVNFRMSLRKLFDPLLDYHLTTNPADVEGFRREAHDLKTWLQAKKMSPMAQSERAAFMKLEAAYGDFLARVDPLAQTNSSPPAGPEGFAATYARLKQDYQPVLRACEEVVGAEHKGFDVFLQESDRTLRSLQRLFMLSLVLLVALAAASALLVYRGMIAPLRAQLTESQALIARQEKLAALGALGAGVAHEIRNPLTAIKFRLFSLRKSLPPSFAENEDARTISEEINRLERIVKDFLQFARPSEPELVPIPAARILQEVRDFMKSELDQAGIDLKLNVSHSAWVSADTNQLKQVLINLIQNSADSIGKNGIITLALKTGAGAFPGNNGSAAILSVTDTGKGIPPEVQKRLFDPFFTTKDGGTGLGLAIAARIVEKHGGLLRYRTEINRGTTFEIVLPGTGDDATEDIADRR